MLLLFLSFLSLDLTSNFKEYGLDKLEFTSFVRITGYNSLLSACDVAYAVTAMLELETQATKTPEDAFHVAFDALNSNAAPSVVLSEGSGASSLVNGGSNAGNIGIGAGIRSALILQKNIYSTAVGLVERKALVRLRHFRYAFLHCTNHEANDPAHAADAEDHVFAKPLALAKLAHFLMDMHRENGKWAGAKARPLVLLAEKPSTQSYVVVGYEFLERPGTFVRNRFGQQFEMTASTMQGSFKFDSFDSNVVEVDAKNAQRFIEQLHYMMDST